MKKAVTVLLASALFTTPLHATEWDEVKPGTFVGFRLTVGGNSGGRPTAALTIAPTQNRISYDGRSMLIGEGIALKFGPDKKPSLTFAGVRADQALGLAPSSTETAGPELGMSDGAKVAVGVGVALVLVAGGTFAYLSSRCTECDQ